MHLIDPDHLSLETIDTIVRENRHLGLSDEARRRLRHCRAYLDDKLQHNLVVSHAAGMGDPVPPEIVRLMLLLKIQSLSYGFSAVREVVVERLADFFNAGILPVVLEHGSLGASGDLAPLAHLSLPLAGLGEVWYQGRRQRADVVLQVLGWEPLTFQAKEALALLNGTQFSTAYAVWCLLESRRLANIADLNAAIGYDAFDCRSTPLDERIHRIRPHAGQLAVAENLRNWLAGSAIAEKEKTNVQDPYSFRCVPQVHGASRDALAHIEQMALTEMNSVTDNPNVFPDDDAILSGGNFHAQPVALPLDYLALALSELGSIAERRIYQLIGGQRGLPPFLTDNAGLHSGMMIAQYTAAAIASQNKTLCTPASADSIVSCNGQEDHVSMAANAATKARRVVLNLERLLAIEFMVTMQALEFRRPLCSSPRIETIREQYREVVPRLTEDRVLSTDMERTVAFLREIG